MTERNDPRLGVLLTRGPDEPEASWAIGLVRAAAARGLVVEVFLMADGVELLSGPEWEALRQPGVRVAVCTKSIVDRGGPTDREGVDYASQFELAKIVDRAGRFVSFC